LNGLVKALKWRLEAAAQVAYSHTFVFVYNGEFICIVLSPWFKENSNCDFEVIKTVAVEITVGILVRNLTTLKMQESRSQ